MPSQLVPQWGVVFECSEEQAVEGFIKQIRSHMPRSYNCIADGKNLGDWECEGFWEFHKKKSSQENDEKKGLVSLCRKSAFKVVQVRKNQRFLLLGAEKPFQL